MPKLIGRREHGYKHPTMDWVDFNGRWVVRDADGKYIDHDQYRNDLKCRLNDETIEFIGD